MIMSYMALYRVWRPQTFSEMVGQKHIKQTLQNALSKRQFSHAYLFSGPRGTGKTSAAKILAKAINCEGGPAAEPCNECTACRQITEGSLMDVVEIDAASNRGVEEIREIRDKIKYAPSGVRYKVYIIDEVHMLTTEAFNALLKTLEEPPAHAVFVLATTEPHKLPATIISRCQRFDFRRIQSEDIVERLAAICESNSVTFEERALQMIARMAEGGLRDATSLLDQAIAMGGERITEEDVLAIAGGVSQTAYAELTQLIAEHQAADCLLWLEAMLERGKSPEKVMDDLIRFYRDLLIIRTIPDGPLTQEMFWLDADYKKWVIQQPSTSFFQAVELLNKLQNEMKWSSRPQIMLEIALIRLCQHAEETGESVEPSQSLQELLNRISALEKEVSELKNTGGQRIEGEEESKKELTGSKGTTTSAHKIIPGAQSHNALRIVEPFLTRMDPNHLQQVESAWAQLLNKVKEKRITVHAWLVDGEPVASLPDAILVAFKNVMHRDTTEKPANREIIEQAFKEIYGTPYRLATVMQNEWKQLRETSTAKEETFALVPPSEDEPCVKEAIDLFGENLVQIQDE